MPCFRVARIMRITVFAIAAFMIFRSLDVPSLWLDEAASPLNARYPVDYIITLSRTLEEHPPLFYLLLKGFLSFGHDDFTVRLLPALCGLGCVVLMAAVGSRLFSPAAGTAAAAIWLAMPQNLLLSRMARPYSLWLLFYLCALYFLAGWLRRGSWRSIAGLVAAAALMVASHYLSFPLLAAMGLCLLAVAPEGRPGWTGRLTAAGLFGAGCAAIAAAAYFTLIAQSHTPQLIANADETVADAARALWEAVGGVLYSFDVLPARLAVGALAAGAFAVLARRDRRHFLILALLTVVPPLVLLAMGRATGLYSRHLSSLGVPLALAMAGAAAAVPGLSRRLPAVTLGALALAVLPPLTVHRDRFYAVTSYQVPVIGNNYKLAAAGIAALDRPGTILSFGNDFYGNTVSWYLDQRRPALALADPRLTSQDPEARLLFAAGTHWGYLAPNAAAFQARFGPGVVRHGIETSTVLELTVPRDPVRRVAALPARYALPLDYRRVFAEVNALSGLRFHQDARGPGLIPARNDVDASAHLAFADDAPFQPQEIRLNVLFDNLGQDNRLAAQVRFDDEPPLTFPLSTGYDATRQRQIALKREAPYARMDVAVVLRCASRTPSLSGGNLHTLRLTGLEAFFCPADDAGACLAEAESRLVASMLDNYLEERFAGPGETDEAARLDVADNLAVADRDESGAWTALAPADRNRPGVTRLSLTTARPRLLFFPRLGPGGAVRVYGRRPDGGRELLFAMHNAGEKWTPISARYELTTPKWLRGRPAEVEIELHGRWSQLWTLGDATLF
jgi:hypothetical protein